MSEKISLKLMEALDAVWSKIRSLHPEVPEVILLAAPSPRHQMNVLGHFAALRWRTKKQEIFNLHEVVVVAEHLDRTPIEITGTLIHEAAHALNFERGVFDCSRSQYHNREFKKAAEEVGLEVVQVPHYGFAMTRMSPKTVEIYAEAMTGLELALAHRYRPKQRLSGGSVSGQDEDSKESRNRKAICGCPYIIRVSRKTLAETEIKCEKCGELFTLS